MKVISNCLVICVAIILWANSVLAERAIPVSDALWANGKLFNTVLTDTSFTLPPTQSTDVLYNFGLSGLAGQRAVSASAPGDRDYNGGRWAVKVAVFTDLGKSIHDPDNNGIVNFELTSEDEVLSFQALGHLDIIDTTIYFECPLIPKKRGLVQ